MITIKNTLPDVGEVLKMLPIDEKLQKLKVQFDEKIKGNIANRDKFIVVVGPCSADRNDSMIEYLKKLKQLQLAVGDKITIVARVYTAKPRTDGGGYLGKIFGNYGENDIDIANGLIESRKLMLSCLQIGLPIADELLYPFALPYLSDLVSYYFVGARSSLDPMHRDYASSVDQAVGVKNSIDGDLAAVSKSVATINKPKIFAHEGNIVESSGNKYAHTVLRGYHDGKQFVSNSDSQSTLRALELAKQCNHCHPFIMVDCSHANSGKVACRQIDNALAVVNDNNVGGIILESYLNGGSSDKCLYGTSVTDACLSWEETEKLIKQLHEKLA